MPIKRRVSAKKINYIEQLQLMFLYCYLNMILLHSKIKQNIKRTKRPKINAMKSDSQNIKRTTKCPKINAMKSDSRAKWQILSSTKFPPKISRKLM